MEKFNFAAPLYTTLIFDIYSDDEAEVCLNDKKLVKSDNGYQNPSSNLNKRKNNGRNSLVKNDETRIQSLEEYKITSQESSVIENMYDNKKKKRMRGPRSKWVGIDDVICIDEIEGQKCPEHISETISKIDSSAKENTEIEAHNKIHEYDHNTKINTVNILENDNASIKYSDMGIQTPAAEFNYNFQASLVTRAKKNRMRGPKSKWLDTDSDHVKCINKTAIPNNLVNKNYSKSNSLNHNNVETNTQYKKLKNDDSYIRKNNIKELQKYEEINDCSVKFREIGIQTLLSRSKTTFRNFMVCKKTKQNKKKKRATNLRRKLINVDTAHSNGAISMFKKAQHMSLEQNNINTSYRIEIVNKKKYCKNDDSKYENTIKEEEHFNNNLNNVEIIVIDETKCNDTKNKSSFNTLNSLTDNNTVIDKTYNKNNQNDRKYAIKDLDHLNKRLQEETYVTAQSERADKNIQNSNNTNTRDSSYIQAHKETENESLNFLSEAQSLEVPVNIESTVKTDISSKIQDHNQQQSIPIKTLTESLNNTEMVDKNLKEELKTLAENIIYILISFNSWNSIYNSSNVKESLVAQAKQYFASTKYHFFENSYNSILNIILPRENDITFIKNFLNYTIQLACSKSYPYTFAQVEPLYIEMIDWVKNKQVLRQRLSINHSSSQSVERPSLRQIRKPIRNHQAGSGSNDTPAETLNQNLNIGSQYHGHTQLICPTRLGDTETVIPPQNIHQYYEKQIYHQPNNNTSYGFIVRPQVLNTQINHIRAPFNLNNGEIVTNWQASRPQNQVTYSGESRPIWQNHAFTLSQHQSQQQLVSSSQNNQYTEDNRVQSYQNTKTLSDSGFISPPNLIGRSDMINVQEQHRLQAPNMSYVVQGKCAVCHKITKHQCLGCFKHYYCSQICQNLDRNNHTALCNTSTGL